MYLNETLIRNFLKTKPLSFEAIHFYLFSSINSTNQFLKELKPNEGLSICCSEAQTQGRGRLNRSWFSPYGENIYCSMRWKLDCDLADLSGLSLVVGLASLACLNESHPNLDLKLKWPNDIFWRNQKLGGILIETIETRDVRSFSKRKNTSPPQSLGINNAENYTKSLNVIIGIGLNINMDTRSLSLANNTNAWCSLFEITEKKFDRNIILGHLIYQLDLYMNQFIRIGFEGFIDQWDQVDLLRGKTVTSYQQKKIIEGKAQGVNQLGQLCIKDETGHFYFLSSGEASVKYT